MKPADARVLAASTFLAAISAFFVASLTGHDTLRLVLKPVPVWSLAAWVFFQDTRLSRWVLGGLLLGSVGDIFLETRDPAQFVPGLVAFLLGHVVYVVGFTREAKALAALRALPFLGMVVVVLAVALPKAGNLAAPIGVYGLIIGLMGWRAAVRVGAGEPALYPWLGLAGAALFAFSDSLIAVNKFVAPFESARPIILVTYWAAQALITASVPPRAADAT